MFLFWFFARAVFFQLEENVVTLFIMVPYVFIISTISFVLYSKLSIAPSFFLYKIRVEIAKSNRGPFGSVIFWNTSWSFSILPVNAALIYHEGMHYNAIIYLELEKIKLENFEICCWYIRHFNYSLNWGR